LNQSATENFAAEELSHLSMSSPQEIQKGPSEEEKAIPPNPCNTLQPQPNKKRTSQELNTGADPGDLAKIYSQEAKRKKPDLYIANPASPVLVCEKINYYKELKVKLLKGYNMLQEIDIDDDKKMIEIDSEMISLNQLPDTFSKASEDIIYSRKEYKKFFCSQACQQVYNQLVSDNHLKYKLAFVQGPSGFGKSYALLYTLLKLRKNIKYTVLYIPKACNAGFQGQYMLHEILKCCYLLRKDLVKPIPENFPKFLNASQLLKDYMLENPNAEPLEIWYEFLRNLDFWDNSKKKINDPYNSLLYEIEKYCSNHNQFFVIIIDQENTLFSEKNYHLELAMALRKLSCHHMIISASNNNQGFELKIGEPTRINIDFPFNDDEAKLYIQNSKLNECTKDDNLLELISETSQNIPGELMYLNKNYTDKSDKNDAETHLSECIENYRGERIKEFGVSHGMFIGPLLSNILNKERLIRSYFLVDKKVNIEGIEIYDRSLMYIKENKLFSLCPVAANFFKEQLIMLVKDEPEPWKKYDSMISNAEDPIAKSCMLEEAIKMFFVIKILKGQPIKLKLWNGTESEKFEMLISEYNTLSMKFGAKSMDYYKQIAKSCTKSVLFNLPRTFPAVDIIICGEKISEGSKKVPFLYGINITSNILDHDPRTNKLKSSKEENKGKNQKKKFKGRNSPMNFIHPEKQARHPFFVPAFRNLYKEELDLKFIWMGGKTDNEPKIQEMIKDYNTNLGIEDKKKFSVWYVMSEKDENDLPHINLNWSVKDK